MQAGLLLWFAVIGIIAKAGIIIVAQIGIPGAILDALHLVGVLEHTDGQAAAIETGLELVIGLGTRLRASGRDEAGCYLRTAVTIADTLAATVTVVLIWEIYL